MRLPRLVHLYHGTYAGEMGYCTVYIWSSLLDTWYGLLERL